MQNPLLLVISTAGATGRRSNWALNLGVKANLENMHDQKLINYFNTIHYLFSPPKETYLKLHKCNLRESGEIACIQW